MQSSSNSVEGKQKYLPELKDKLCGVLKSDMHKYKMDRNGMFTCLDGNEKFTYDFLNDDFCDCKDKSDEPGTSACTGGK